MSSIQKTGGRGRRAPARPSSARETLICKLIGEPEWPRRWQVPTSIRRDYPLRATEKVVNTAIRLQPNPRQRYAPFSEFLQDFTVPNAQLEGDIERQPLMKKHPLAVWQVLCLILLLLNLWQLAR